MPKLLSYGYGPYGNHLLFGSVTGRPLLARADGTASGMAISIVSRDIAAISGIFIRNFLQNAGRDCRAFKIIPDLLDREALGSTGIEVVSYGYVHPPGGPGL